MFTDDENDTITFDTSATNDTITGLTINKTEGSCAGTPDASIVDDTVHKTITWIPQDNHYPDTDRNEFTQKLLVYPNRAPYNTSTISDQQFDAGYAVSFSFASGLFVDDDGEPLIYTFGTNPTATSWLSFNSSSRTFSGTPQPNDDANNYTVTVYAQDNNTNSGDGNTTFYLNIVPNEIPELDKGLYTPVVNKTVYEEWSYTVPIDAFKDSENDAISITHELIPNNFNTIYDSSTRTVTGTLQDNTKFGNYTMKFSVQDSWNVSTLTESFRFEYYENMPPVVNTQPSNAS